MYILEEKSFQIPSRCMNPLNLEDYTILNEEAKEFSLKIINLEGNMHQQLLEAKVACSDFQSKYQYCLHILEYMSNQQLANEASLESLLKYFNSLKTKFLNSQKKDNKLATQLESIYKNFESDMDKLDEFTIEMNGEEQHLTKFADKTQMRDWLVKCRDTQSIIYVYIYIYI